MTTGRRAASSLLPTSVQTPIGPFLVATHRPVGPDTPWLHALADLPEQVRATLGVEVPAGTAPILVYVLQDRSAFEHYLRYHHPELPARRAFFLAEGDRRTIYAFEGDQLAVDLRHEGTHALLHAAGLDMPVWLDEGLAECFEGDGGPSVLHPEHAPKLVARMASGWRPDLRRLERIGEARSMTLEEYRESWAWAYTLLNGAERDQSALRGYLADIHREGPGHAAPLSARAGPETIRLQDGRPRLKDRIRDWLRRAGSRLQIAPARG